MRRRWLHEIGRKEVQAAQRIHLAAAERQLQNWKLCTQHGITRDIPRCHAASSDVDAWVMRHDAAAANQQLGDQQRLQNQLPTS
jgi:hypothetical protein